jgi:hypothetical protein
MNNLQNKDLTVLLASLLLTLTAFIYGTGFGAATGVLVRAPFLYSKQRDSFHQYVQL